MKHKKHVVFGVGSIGQVVISALRKADRYDDIFAGLKTPERCAAWSEWDTGARPLWVDVSDRAEMETMVQVGSGLLNDLDSVIYAVGHCPKDGFKDVNQPLSKLSLAMYLNEVMMHQIGVLNVFQCMLPLVKDGGAFAFVSSGITRFPDHDQKGLPGPIAQVGYHIGVIRAMDSLIYQMRVDPKVIERKIKIHRIVLPAVRTHFHRVPPPGSISTEEAAQRVVDSLASDQHVDQIPS